MEDWGKCSKRAILRGRIDFLNRKGETFDWDTNDLADLQAIGKQPKLVHLDIISEIPAVNTAGIYDGMIGPTPIGEEEKPPSYVEHTAKARKNAGLDTNNQAREVIRKQYEVIVIYGDDVDIVQGVFVKEDPVDCFSVSGEDIFPRQEMVNPDKINEVSAKG